MNVISSLGTPARRSRSTDLGATPLVPEPRDARPAATTSSDQPQQQSSGQAPTR